VDKTENSHESTRLIGSNYINTVVPGTKVYPARPGAEKEEMKNRPLAFHG
jgi:hypothetical protein